MLLRNVVVGSDLESAVYSFLTDSFYLDTCSFGPVFYQQPSIKIMGSDRADFTRTRILLLLSLQGKLLSCTPPAGLKIRDNRVIFTRDGQVYKYLFQKCEIFDSTGVDLENSLIHAQPPEFIVYDDFELSHLGAKHKSLPPKISHADSLASEIHFYISDRVDGANYITDCIAQSKLSREQINDFEYSDSMARFCVERYLESIGIMGTFMRFYKSGKSKFRKPKVIHRSRVVIQRDRNIYKESDLVKFKNTSLREIFDEIST